MSLAPVGLPALPEGDAARPVRPGTGSAATGSCSPAGHSSLTLYIQLFLSGYGLELDDLKALRTWGSLTPGHPEYTTPPGVEITTGPLGQGLASAVGMAMRPAPRSAACSTPTPRPGESPFDHHIYVHRLRRRPRGGRLRRGLLARRAPGARQPHRDLRRQPDLHRGRHRHRVHRGRRQARYEAYGWHVAATSTGAARGDGGDYTEDVQALLRRHRARQAGRPTSRPSSRCTPSSRWPAPTQAEHRQVARLGPRRRRGRRHQEAARLRPGADASQVDDDVLAHTREVVDARQGRRTPTWHEDVRRLAQAANPERAALLDRVARPRAARRAGRRPCRSSPPTPRASPPAPRPARCSTRSAAIMPELWGGSADLAESNNTTMEGEPSFIPTGQQPPASGRAAPTAARCTSASASTPWASILNGIALRRPDPPLRRHVPGLLRLHAPRGPARRPHAAAGHLTSGRTTRSASARTARPTSRSSTSPRCAPSRAWTSSARPTPTRPPRRGRAILSNTDRPAGLALTRQNVPTSTAARRYAIGRRASPRAATSSPTAATATRDVVLDRHRLRGAARRRGRA